MRTENISSVARLKDAQHRPRFNWNFNDFADSRNGSVTVLFGGKTTSSSTHCVPNNENVFGAALGHIKNKGRSHSNDTRSVSIDINARVARKRRLRSISPHRDNNVRQGDCGPSRLRSCVNVPPNTAEYFRNEQRKQQLFELKKFSSELHGNVELTLRSLALNKQPREVQLPDVVQVCSTCDPFKQRLSDLVENERLYSRPTKKAKLKDDMKFHEKERLSGGVTRVMSLYDQRLERLRSMASSKERREVQVPMGSAQALSSSPRYMPDSEQEEYGSPAYNPKSPEYT